MKTNFKILRAAALTASSVLALGLASPAVAQMGFSISVDGTNVAGDPVPADQERRVDKALDSMDIQVTFDGLDAAPSLNVLPVDRRSAYRAGEAVTGSGHELHRIELVARFEGDVGLCLAVGNARRIGKDTRWKADDLALGGRGVFFLGTWGGAGNDRGQRDSSGESNGM